jgi:hypothetical protein
MSAQFHAELEQRAAQRSEDDITALLNSAHALQRAVIEHMARVDALLKNVRAQRASQQSN